MEISFLSSSIIQKHTLINTATIKKYFSISLVKCGVSANIDLSAMLKMYAIYLYVRVGLLNCNFNTTLPLQLTWIYTVLKHELSGWHSSLMQFHNVLPWLQLWPDIDHDLSIDLYSSLDNSLQVCCPLLFSNIRCREFYYCLTYVNF